MGARFGTFWENLRASFWFVPALMVAAALLLSTFTLLLDSQFDSGLGGISWVYTGGPAGARSLLSTIASSVVGVAGTTFSITIAVLTLASSQFGPRLLRTFVRDRGNQFVLGTFIATFTYCLLVLRTIHEANDLLNIDALVPNISVTTAMVLALMSLAVLIYFIHHVATMIQADQVIASVGGELRDTINDLFPKHVGQNETPQETPPAPGPLAARITSGGHGYVQALDTDGLLRIANDNNGVLWLLAQPGDFVFDGRVLARFETGSTVDENLRHAIERCFVLGIQRTPYQDLTFAIQQLVEIAVRALSPGINDPFTAVSCIDQLGAALVQLAQRQMPSPGRYNEDHALRLVLSAPTFAGSVGTAFDQIRQNGQSNATISKHLIDTLAVIAEHTRDPEHHKALLEQASIIEHGIEQGIPEAADRAAIHASYAALRRRCAANS